MLRPAVKVLVAEPETVSTPVERLVEVALVEVLFSAVKLSKVEEPERRRLESEVKPAVAVKVPVKFAALDMV